MNPYVKFLSLLTCTSILSQGAEVFIDTKSMSLAQITLSDQYCKTIKEHRKLCKQKALSYIDYEDNDLPQFLYGLKTHLAPVVKAYQDNDLKSSTLSELKEYDGDISGEWNNANTIELFSKTETTYTLSTTSSGYTGGAHGYHGTHFDNYSIDTQKILKLEDLFLPDTNATLVDIAKKHYKVSRGLKPRQSLTEDNWFEDTFVLAGTFAITPRGLLFYYNSYEIKAYAAGHTQFMLPYSKIQEIIDPKGPLHFALGKKKLTKVTFYEKEEAKLDLKVQHNTDTTITITATMQNLAYLNKGWFSLSFPQISSKKQILSMRKSGFKKLHAYPKGKKIYHNILRKAVKAKYLLVEAESDSWDQDTYSISLTLQAPKKSKEFIIDMRANLKSKTKTISIPAYDGIEGQQGFQNYRVFIQL